MPPAIIPALISAAVTAYSAYESSRHRGGTPGMAGPTGPTPADLAAGGATRVGLMGAATPTWAGGLTGANVPGVSSGGGSASIGDLGQRASGSPSGLGQQADEFMKVLGGP